MFKSVAIAMAAGSALAGGISAAEAATPVTVQVSLDNVVLSSGQTYSGSIDLSSYLTGSNGELYRPTEIGAYAIGYSAPVTQQYGGVFSATRSVVDVEKTYAVLVAAKAANPKVDFSDVTPYLAYSPVGVSESYSVQIDNQPDYLFMSAGGVTGGSAEFPLTVTLSTTAIAIMQAASMNTSPSSVQVPLTHLNGTPFDVLGGAIPYVEAYEPGTSLVVTHPDLPSTEYSGVYASYAGMIMSGSAPASVWEQFGSHPGITPGASEFPISAVDPVTGLFNYTLTASTNGIVSVDKVGVSFVLQQIGSAPAVPEPTSWAMMLVGFGAIGAAMRRRRTTIRFA